ncbi:MAG: hypothetical protein GY847_18730 [Proteobacteria bacterium]|nr:hypothetical protein [Pseudomonadota bacterium]
MIDKIRWQWVGLGFLVILGLMAILLGALITISWLAFDLILETQIRDLSAMTEEFIGLAIAAVTLFLAAFGLGGLAIAWLTGRSTVVEPAIAAVLVFGLLGVVGSALTDDALIVAAIISLPSVALAGLGGRMGEFFTGRKTKT